MIFTMVGCSGDPDTPANTDAVAAAMTSAGGSSFFYHLGDITYTPDEKGGGSSADDSTADDEHKLWNACSGGAGTPKTAPFTAVTSGSFQFPNGDSARVEYFDDHTTGGAFGFLQVSLAGRILSGQLVDSSKKVRDQFSLDLDSHQYR